MEVTHIVPDRGRTLTRSTSLSTCKRAKERLAVHKRIIRLRKKNPSIIVRKSRSHRWTHIHTRQEAHLTSMEMMALQTLHNSSEISIRIISKKAPAKRKRRSLNITKIDKVLKRMRNEF